LADFASLKVRSRWPYRVQGYTRMLAQPEEFAPEEPSSDAPRFRVGEVIADRYELRQCIGAGAMGAVFRAQDRVLDAELAIKLIRLNPERTDNERATRRLLFEARAIARISHPGIVRVFDFGCPSGVPFIVMELLEGESLLELMLREGPLKPERAVRLLLPIPDALAVAHRRGVVHRDIKPENVFLSRDDFGRVYPKLVDFGVARLSEGGSGMTRPGALMGTPDYMAPEQAHAEPDVDHRADIWALAVVLYELMTQQRPFSTGHSSYLATLQTIVSEPPTPLAAYGVNEELLWAILQKAIQKPREARFQNMREMGEALARWLIDRGISEDAYGSSLTSTWLPAEPGSVESERATPSADRESITQPRAAAISRVEEGGTLSPPAMAVPPLLVTQAPSTEAVKSSPLETTSSGAVSSRPRLPRGGPLSGVVSKRWPLIVAALLAAVIAGVTSGGLVWLSGARGPAEPVLSGPP
jgi:serine/threonine-protein kinase